MQVETQQSAAWWARPRGSQQQSWIANYRNSLHARHRTHIVELVRSLAPATLLEVGAHCGPNLVRLAQEFPDLRLQGVDVNAEAVQAGQDWIAGLGLASRVRLDVGRVPDATETLPSASCDVVLSCYALAYMAPPDLDAVLYELGRLATRAVLLAEPIASGPTQQWAQTLGGYSEWAHDYRAAVKWIGSLAGWTTRIVPVDPPVDRLNGIVVVSRD